MANEHDCSGFLAKLAEDYERSCTFLSELENSLKKRPDLLAGAPGVAGYAVNEHGVVDEADSDEEEPNEGHEQPSQKSNDISQPSTFRSKVVGLFSRKQPTLPVEDEPKEFGMPKRRISIVDVGSDLPERRMPQRAASLAALRPSSALYRSGPRSPMVTRQQHHTTQESQELHRVSVRNLRPNSSAQRCLSMEFIGRRSIELQTPERSPTGVSLPDIQPQASRSSLQTQGSRNSNAEAAVAATTTFTAVLAAAAAPETPNHPEPVPLPAASRDLRTRPPSISRLIGQNADCCLSPHQQQPGSPSSPTLLEASPRVARRSSFSNGRLLRMSINGGAWQRAGGSASAVLPHVSTCDSVTAGAAADDAGDADFLERSGLVVVGSGGPAAAAVLSRAAPNASQAGSLCDAQLLLATPMRSRSTRTITSLTGVAAENAHRRMSFRQSNGGVAAAAAVAAMDAEAARRRDGPLSQSNFAPSSRDYAAEVPFKGTMHLI